MPKDIRLLLAFNYSLSVRLRECSPVARRWIEQTIAENKFIVSELLASR